MFVPHHNYFKKFPRKRIKTRGPSGGGGGGYSVLSLKVRQGAFTADGPGLPFMTCASLCPTLLPQAEDMLPRSGEQHIAATSTAPGSVVGKNLFGGQQIDIQ